MYSQAQPFQNQNSGTVHAQSSTQLLLQNQLHNNQNSTDISKSSFPNRKISQNRIHQSDQNKSSIRYQRTNLKNRPYEVLKFVAKTKLSEVNNIAQKIVYKNVVVPLPEVNAIVNEIGYDFENDDAQYFWFLKRILTAELPLGWVKETSIMGEAFYHNEQINATSTKHPYIKHFRKLFNKIINNKKTIKFQVQDDIASNKKPENTTKSKRATFVVKNTVELEKFIEEQAVEREVYGENEINDLKSLLKGLQNNSANQFKKFMETASLGKALNFYEKLIGLELKKVPAFLKNHPNFLKISPEELVQLAFHYKIDLRTEIDLLWIPRMINCLPLPPFWKKLQAEKAFDKNNLIEEKYKIFYKDLESNSQFNFHPCKLFIIKLINKKRLEKINQGFASQITNRKDARGRKTSARINVSLANQEVKFMDNLHRIYKCTAKDLYEFASETINLEVKALDDVFEYDMHKIEKEYEIFAQVFQTQVSLQIHEKQLTDHEIRALAEQCKLNVERDTYLYKSMYEFLAQKYQEQDEQLLEFERKQQNQDRIILTQSETPKVWIFRQTIEGPYYWIEKHSKEISSVFPFIRDLRKLIEEIKVTNAAVEQYVKSNTEIKALKKVENYMKLKHYSSSYIDRLVQSQLPNQNNDMDSSYSQEESEQLDNQGFLDKIIRDLDIEDEITNEQLLQWMFSWPYEMSEEYFLQKEEIQKKIDEDLKLIREKSQIRKQTMDRMIKKINVLNRIGKAFGSKSILQSNKPVLNDQQMRRIQEEELLKKIKKTKAVIGVSDIRIRKKLRVLLTKAMQDEGQREKLQGLELIEKELLESTQKKKQDQLRQQLKDQLGLDDSDMEDGEEYENESIADSTQDKRQVHSYEDYSDEDSVQHFEDEENDPYIDEPEDDSFTYKPGQNNTNEDQDKANTTDPTEPLNIIEIDFLSNDQQARLLSEEKNDQLSPAANLENQHSLESIVDETLEARRKRLENQMIQNKLKELSESSSFIKRVRRKLRQMNITKTQDDLKKKIIKLKMMQLRIQGQEQNQAQQESTEQKHDDLDFLSEILRLQELNSSSDESLKNDSSVSMVSRISEVKSMFEDSNYEFKIEQIDNDFKENLRENNIKSRQSTQQRDQNDFYEDFDDIKRIEAIYFSRKKSDSSILQQSNDKFRNSLIIDSELDVLRQSSSKRQSSAKIDRSSSRQTSNRNGSNLYPSPHRFTNPNSKEQTPLTDGKNQINRQSSQPLDQERDTLRLSLVSLQKQRQGSFRDAKSKKTISQFSMDNTSQKSGSDRQNFNELQAQINAESQFKQRRTFMVSKLEKVDEELDSRNESKIDGFQFSSSPPKLNEERRKQLQDLQQKRKMSNRDHLTQIRELSRISSLENTLNFRQQLTVKSQTEQSVELLETLPEDVEFQNFMNKIKVFEDEEDDKVNISTLDGLSRFILDYYYRTVGEPKHTKEQLKLCSKFTESLNIDSILFTAQKLRIKVLAQRETDLLWISQEYLVHPNPNQSDYKGDKPAENPLERMKNYYFQLLVKEQRKLRVEAISKEVNDADDLEKYMRDNSWLTIYEKGEFFKYNFQSKEKEQLNLNQTQQNQDSQSQQQIQATMSGGLISFLKKRGILTTPGTLSFQQQNSQQQSPPTPSKLPSKQPAVPYTTPITILNKPQAFQQSDMLKQFSDQLQAKFLLQKKYESGDVAQISNQDQNRQDMISPFKDKGPNVFQRANRKQSSQIPSLQIEDIDRILQGTIMQFNDQQPNNKQENVKIARNNTQSSYKEILESQESDMNIQGSGQKVQLDPIFPQTFESSELAKHKRFFQKKQASDLMSNNPIFSTFEYKSQNPSHSNSSQNFFSSRVGTQQNQRQNILSLDGNLGQFQSKRNSNQGYESIQSNCKNENQQRVTGFQNERNLLNRPQTTMNEPFMEVIRPVRNIKRVIIGNHQESMTRRQIQHLEQTQSLKDLKESTICYKYLDKHLNSQYLSPSDDMSMTLQNSSNFNAKIFQKLQENIKLKPMSYLTQKEYQHTLDRVHEEIEYEKEAYQKKMEIAQSLTTSIPYNYHRLLRENQEIRQEFVQKTSEKGINIPELNGSSSVRLMTQKFSTRSQLRGGSQTQRDIKTNNFRNMSPKSLQRWAKRSDLNYDMSKRIGLLKKSQGIVNYSRLRRNQEDKMVFSKLLQL